MSAPSEDAPKPKEKSYRETAYAYHGLHPAEKEKLLSTATSMKAGMDALMLLVLDRWGYHKPGSAIRAFDAKNTFAWYQRQRGHHAFEPAPQAPQPATAEMLCLLQQMHQLSAYPSFIE